MRVRSVVKWLAIAGVVVYLAALALLWVAQRRLLYVPFGAIETPAVAGLPGAEVITLTTEDGETLRGWFVPPRDGRPVVLYFHGNGGSLENRAQRFATLTQTGDGLLAIDYRGYPGSSGSPSEAGLKRDADAAYAYLGRRQVPADRLVVVGESLGTGLAVAVAAAHPCAALVLDSPYSSIADVAAAQFPFAPIRLILHDQFRSDLSIGRVTAPILMVHGTGDQEIPLRFAEKLYALAPEPKQLMRIEGAGHLAMEYVLPQVMDWIDRTLS